MKIAVASGKGGTGKTTVAASLALSLAHNGNVHYLDCDVEAPNGHLYLNPHFSSQSEAVVLIPQIDHARCTGCGRCVEVCQFHALAKIQNLAIVFPELCHGCGSCTWNCPEHAITETPRALGLIESGTARDGIRFTRGLLTAGEPMPTPVIRQLKRAASPEEDSIAILDSPPGASCSVVETLRGSDFALLVTEPTPFGLHDLKQVITIAEEMGIPYGIVVNRDGIGGDSLETFLAENSRAAFMRIPYRRELAAGIAAGKTIIDIMPEYKHDFNRLFGRIEDSLKGVGV